MVSYSDPLRANSKAWEPSCLTQRIAAGPAAPVRGPQRAPDLKPGTTQGMPRGRCVRAGPARSRGVSRLVCAVSRAHRKEAGARSHLLRAHSCMRAYICEQAQRFGRADVRAARSAHCGACAIVGSRAPFVCAQRQQNTALGWVVPVGTAASLWGA